MSKFFRSGGSSSSSEDEDDEIEDNTESQSLTFDRADIDASANESALSIAAPGATASRKHSSQQWTSHHKDVLLHALLEDWCLNETVKANASATRDGPEIQAEARARYQRLVAQLAPLDVLPASLGADQHATTRQRYRDVLSVFDRQNSLGAVPLGGRRLIGDGSYDGALFQQAQVLEELQTGTMHNRLALQAPLRRLLGHDEHNSGLGGTLSSTSHSPYRGMMQSAVPPGHGQTRYHSDFEELSILGRGGYGIVYHARNRLDNQAYAVKKVPLSPARLHRIRTRGQMEVDEILLELRTLARLHHPNIVRYFNAWVEWAAGSTPDAMETSTISQEGVETEVSASVGADEDRHAVPRRGITDVEIDGNDIVFEHSANVDSAHVDDASHSVSSEHSEPHLQRTRTRSTIATVSDETVESIDREPDVSVSIQSAAEGAHFAQPTLAIHIQMSLHPMTLADLLGSASSDDGALRHCFHLEPAVGIIGAVLDGLEYLHEEGVVHRDIKPANIFLSPSRSRGARRNCVDLRRCVDCEGGINLAAGELDVCIGDFGLATMAGRDEIRESSGPVGTAIYRPTTHRVGNDRSLDIYALGIVFFELLWKFETRMERQHTICALKEGRFPGAFCDLVGKGRGVKVMEYLNGMLALDGDGVAMGVGDVRERLQALLASDE